MRERKAELVTIDQETGLPGHPAIFDGFGGSARGDFLRVPLQEFDGWDVCVVFSLGGVPERSPQVVALAITPHDWKSPPPEGLSRRVLDRIRLSEALRTGLLVLFAGAGMAKPDEADLKAILRRLRLRDKNPSRDDRLFEVARRYLEATSNKGDRLRPIVDMQNQYADERISRSYPAILEDVREAEKAGYLLRHGKGKLRTAGPRFLERASAELAKSERQKRAAKKRPKKRGG